jgi:hypothetical protein
LLLARAVEVVLFVASVDRMRQAQGIEPFADPLAKLAEVAPSARQPATLSRALAPLQRGKDSGVLSRLLLNGIA